MLVGRKGPEAYTFLRGAASGGAGLASASGTASAIGSGAGKGAAGYVGCRSATCCNTSAREAPHYQTISLITYLIISMYLITRVANNKLIIRLITALIRLITALIRLITANNAY